MSKFLCGLGFVCLTLAFLALCGEDSTASDVVNPGHSGAAWNGQHKQDGYRIIRTAAKKKVKKKASKSESSDMPAAGSDTSSTATAAKTEPAGLQFKRDIAPAIVGFCIRCHNEKADARQHKLDLTSYDSMMKGADKEPIIVPGKPDESHMFLRLTEEETPRMPPGNGNQRRMSDTAIEKVGEWIKAGAKLDPGLDPKAPMASYATTVEDFRKDALAKMSVQERDKLVVEKGIERWKKGNLKVTPEATTGKNFVLVGQLPKERVTATLKAMDSQYAQLRPFTKSSGSEPLEKVGLYVFNDRTSFVEFVRSNESREIESTDQGTANMGAEPYVAVLDPLGGREESPSAARKVSRSKKGSDDDSQSSSRSLAGLLTENLAAGLLKADGSKAPLWLTAGFGAYFGSRVDPRSGNTAQLKRGAYANAEQGWSHNVIEALSGDGKIEDIRATSFGIISSIANTPSFVEFVRGMLGGNEKFDDVIRKVFSMDREQFIATTGEFVAGFGRGR